MDTPSVASLDELANEYAARWADERPLRDSVRPANVTNLHRALEANEAYAFLVEILPDYSRCGINE